MSTKVGSGQDAKADREAGGTEADVAEADVAEPTEAEVAEAEADAAKSEDANSAESVIAATDDAGGGAKAGDDGARARRRGPGRGVLVPVVVLLALIAAVATAGLQWYRADQAADEESTREAVQARAGEFGQALLSYDHADLQKARDRVMSLASQDFAKTYDVAFTGGLEGVITKLEADATATVRAVYLGDIDGSTARAIVVMDSEVTSSAGTRRVLGSHLDMQLTFKDDEWRITEVTSIGTARETMTDPKGQQQDGGGTVAPSPGASPSE